MDERRGVVAILAAAAVCLVIAATGAYTMYAVLDESEFADRAASTLSSDEVRQEAADRTAVAAVTVRQDLTRGESAVEEAAAREVSGPAFVSEFRAGAARLHHTLFSDAHANASLRIDGSGAGLRAELRQIPGWEHMARVQDASLFTIGTTGFEGELRMVAPPARELALPLTIIFGLAGLLLFGLGIARARRRAWCGGMTVAVAAGVVAGGITAARDVVLHQFDTGFGEAVVRQIWDAYVGDFRLWALMVGAFGLVVAAAAGGPRLSLRALLATPCARSRRLARAAGLLAVAALAVTLPDLVLHVGLVSLAGAFVYVAAGELLRVLGPTPETSPS